jgi:GH24 family phage-related lysozyme (muramidase)
MLLHKLGVDKMIGYEIGSERPGDLRMYNRKYGLPTVPSNGSGVTIGIGYDLGMNKPHQIQKDWQGKVNANALAFFMSCADKTGLTASKMITPATRFFVPYSAAYEVFRTSTLPRFCRLTKISFPAIEQLNPLAQAVIVGIVYNRGNGLVDVTTTARRERRREEMRNLVGAISKQDYVSIAEEIENMKRLWDGIPDFDGDKEEILRGLVVRREDEAAMILSSTKMVFDNKDIIDIAV